MRWRICFVALEFELRFASFDGLFLLRQTGCVWDNVMPLVEVLVMVADTQLLSLVLARIQMMGNE